jgi:transcriptional regulator with PAS, ATPase and Fis domain
LPLLQRYLVSKFATRYRKDIQGITRRAQSCLARHSWPGNVRELENVIGNASMMVHGAVIDIDDLPESLRRQSSATLVANDSILTLEQIEHRHVLEVLHRVGGNKLRAAEALGIGRNTLYDILSRMKTPASIDRESEEPKDISIRPQNRAG